MIEKALRTIDGPARRILDEALSLKSTSAGGAGSTSPSSSINEDGRNSPTIKQGKMACHVLVGSLSNIGYIRR